MTFGMPRSAALAVGLALILTWGVRSQGGCQSTHIGTLTGTTIGHTFPWCHQVHDAGGGPALYAGGHFLSVAGTLVHHIARWDGSAWSSVGGGVTASSPPAPTVRAMVNFDDGSGAGLFVGGTFDSAGGVPSNSVAQWNGVGWTALGSGLPTAIGNLGVEALLGHDDGSGPALYAGGGFTIASGAPADHIARWNGSTWGPVGGGSDNRVTCFAVFDDGAGACLYAGGWFNAIGGVNAAQIARWDGTSWSHVGGGLTGTFNVYLRTLAVFDDGTGPALFAGGHFTHAGGQPASSIARWDGIAWASLGPGPTYTGGLPQIRSMQVFDDGQGPALYVTGLFDAVAGSPIPNPGPNSWCLARYDGSTWSLVPSQYLGATLAVFDDGLGPDLYVGVDLGSINTNGSIHRLSCTGTTSFSATQPGGPGTPLHLNNANLSPGREYYNLFSVEIVGLPGSGPFLGLHASPGPNLDFLVLQAQLPVGTPPFHFLAPASYLNWGPFPIGPATIDAVCFDFTGGVIGAVSPVARITIL